MDGGTEAESFRIFIPSPPTSVASGPTIADAIEQCCHFFFPSRKRHAVDGGKNPSASSSWVDDSSSPPVSSSTPTNAPRSKPNHIAASPTTAATIAVAAAGSVAPSSSVVATISKSKLGLRLFEAGGSTVGPLLPEDALLEAVLEAAMAAREPLPAMECRSGESHRSSVSRRRPHSVDHPPLSISQRIVFQLVPATGGAAVGGTSTPSPSRRPLFADPRVQVLSSPLRTDELATPRRVQTPLHKMPCDNFLATWGRKEVCAHCLHRRTLHAGATPEAAPSPKVKQTPQTPNPNPASPPEQDVGPSPTKTTTASPSPNKSGSSPMSSPAKRGQKHRRGSAACKQFLAQWGNNSNCQHCYHSISEHREYLDALRHKQEEQRAIRLVYERQQTHRVKICLVPWYRVFVFCPLPTVLQAGKVCRLFALTTRPILKEAMQLVLECTPQLEAQKRLLQHTAEIAKEMTSQAAATSLPVGKRLLTALTVFHRERKKLDDDNENDDLPDLSEVLNGAQNRNSAIFSFAVVSIGEMLTEALSWPAHRELTPNMITAVERIPKLPYETASSLLLELVVYLKGLVVQQTLKKAAERYLSQPFHVI